jgi:hypothetical protein
MERALFFAPVAIVDDDNALVPLPDGVLVRMASMKVATNQQGTPRIVRTRTAAVGDGDNAQGSLP